MFIAELVSFNQVLPKFHSLAEQVTGTNPASRLQNSKRPRSKDAYILSYFKTFQDPLSDISDIKPLRGLLHVGVVCAAHPDDMDMVVKQPHDLKVLSSPATREAVAVLFSGDLDQWANALYAASRIPYAEPRSWSAACYAQFAKHDLSVLLDVEPPKKINGYLTY